MPDFGSLRNVDLRQVWPREAADFTPWLAANLETLSAAIGLELELVESEAAVGDFSLDLLARDLGTGRHVIIENQLTATDHDHLGKLITYAAGFDAGAIIWLAQSIRDEHRQAMEWLNQRTNEETHFFAVVVEVLQIDDSRPAFNFKPVVFPNEWVRGGLASASRSTTSRGEAYRQFFQELIDDLRENYRFTAARVGQPQNWYSFSTGISGVHYSASFAKFGRVRTELYLKIGDAVQTKALYDRLHAARVSIENAFGQPLEWERLDEGIASRVASYFPGSISEPPDRLIDIRTEIVKRLLKFKEAVIPFVRICVEEGEADDESANYATNNLQHGQTP